MYCNNYFFYLSVFTSIEPNFSQDKEHPLFHIRLLYQIFMGNGYIPENFSKGDYCSRKSFASLVYFQSYLGEPDFKEKWLH